MRGRRSDGAELPDFLPLRPLAGVWLDAGADFGSPLAEVPQPAVGVRARQVAAGLWSTQA